MKPHVLTLAAVAAVLAGCAVPVVPPEDTAMEAPAAPAAVPAVRPDWWTSFGDARLDALVREALEHNRDIARAIETLNEARASLRSADADRAPTVDAGITATRRRATRNGPNPLPNNTPYSTDLTAALNVSYELDLWGRLGATSRAAREQLLASTHARDTVRLAVAAQVVQADATLQALDAQFRLYSEAVQAQRSALDLQRVRLQGGDIAELDIRQLEAELAANEVQLPQLTRAIGDAERSLAVLLGRSPRAMLESHVERGVTVGSAATAPDLPQGLPSDLLQRRPDVAAAEARLRAAGARLDAVRAAYFPSLALTGSLGKESDSLSRLLDGPSTIWSVVASLTQPIWNAGRLEAGFDASLSQRRQAELDYRDAVATAFREAGDALAAHDEARQTLAKLEQRRQTLQRASELTRLRFEGGIASRLDDINAQRAALAAGAQVEDAKRAVRVAQTALYKALGGGWTPVAAQP